MPSISKTHTDFDWLNLSQKIRDSLQEIHPDSKLYQMIDEKCFFCNCIITKNDACPPNEVYDATISGEKLTAHGKCMEYATKKYPNVPIMELEKKIVRIRVDQTVI